MNNEQYIDLLESRIDELEAKDEAQKKLLKEYRKIRAVIKSQTGLQKYVESVMQTKETRLYTTTELAEMCNWELGTYERKMTELLSADYYSKHGCKPSYVNDRPVYPRYMLQIMQTHLERKFG